jgi:hypothetical protein
MRENQGEAMKHQGYNKRLDESLGARHSGAHKQGFKARRDESKGMEKALGHRAYSADKNMDKNSTQEHGMHGRKPWWAQGSMEGGFPRQNVSKEMDRMDSSCQCKYAPPGYNRELLSRAHKKMDSDAKGFQKGDYV